MSRKKRKHRRDEEPEEEDILNEEDDEEEEEDDEEEDDEEDDEDEEEYSDEELEDELDEGDVDEEDDDGEEEDDEDDEEEDDDGEESSKASSADEEDPYVYTVQYDSIDGDGTPRKAGDTVKVACKNCALWQQAWGGKVHCDKGKIVNDNECHPNTFSCLAYFWPFDCAHLLKDFLEMGPAEVLLINRMRIGMRRVLGGPVGGKKGQGWMSHREWVEEWAERQGLEIDADEAWRLALDYMRKFDSYDQIDFPYEFFDTYAGKVKKHLTAERRRKGKPRGFVKGDMVEWLNRGDGARLRGMVFPLGGKGSKGKIRVVVITESHELAGAQCDFVVDEWKRDCDPKVVVQAKV